MSGTPIETRRRGHGYAREISAPGEKMVSIRSQTWAILLGITNPVALLVRVEELNVDEGEDEEETGEEEEEGERDYMKKEDEDEIDDEEGDIEMDERVEEEVSFFEQ